MKQKFFFLAAAALLFAACSTKQASDSESSTLPEADSSDFVTLTEAVPDAILEIRYYSTYNFIGSRIEGYLQPTALLTRQAAESLRQVSDELKAQGYRLKIYDAYRPQMAVDPQARSGTLCSGASRIWTCG